MKRRQLPNHIIRALAYEAAADDIESGLGISDNPGTLIEKAGGSERDLGALERQMRLVAERLRKRAAAIRGTNH